MSRRALVLPVLATATALVAAGLVAGPAVAATPHGRSAVTFTSTKSHHAVAPATTRPGVAHLRFVDTYDHDAFDELIVVQAKHPGRSSAGEVAHDLNRTSPATLLVNYRLTAILKEKSGIYAHLTRGTFYVADGEKDKFTASDISSMGVTGARVDARVPASRGTRVTSHRSLSIPGTLPSAGWLHLRNNSSSLCDLVLLPVNAKATNAQLRDLVAHPTEKKLDAVIGDHGFSFDLAPLSIFGPHSATWVHYHGSARRYVAELDPFTGASSPQLRSGRIRVVTLK